MAVLGSSVTCKLEVLPFPIVFGISLPLVKILCQSFSYTHPKSSKFHLFLSKKSKSIEISSKSHESLYLECNLLIFFASVLNTKCFSQSGVPYPGLPNFCSLLVILCSSAQRKPRVNQPSMYLQESIKSKVIKDSYLCKRGIEPWTNRTTYPCGKQR